MIEPYYANRNVTLYHGSCFDIVPELGAGAFDAVVTDPPYGLRCCSWDEPLDVHATCALLRTACKRDGARVVFADMRFAARLVTADPKDFRYDLVYRKRCPGGILNANRQPLRAHENILVFYGRSPVYHPQKSTGKRYVKPPRVTHSENYKRDRGGIVSAAVDTCLRYPTSVIDSGFNSTTRKREASRSGGNHPTQKPVHVVEWLMRTYTDPGGLILDPFAGSGTAGVAAMRSGRRCVLVEREERYCEMAARRLMDEETLFDCAEVG